MAAAVLNRLGAASTSSILRSVFSRSREDHMLFMHLFLVVVVHAQRDTLAQ